MISVEEAKKIIEQNIPERKNQILPLKEAFGHTTAEDIYSKYDIPNFSQSSMDGYAIRFEDKDLKLKISGEMQAGSTEKFHLEKGIPAVFLRELPFPSAQIPSLCRKKP